MVLISSLYPVRDARSWPDKFHDAWLALGLALGWPLAWPLAGPWPGPWLARFRPVPVQTSSGSDWFRFRPVPVQTGSVQVIPVRFAAILEDPSGSIRDITAHLIHDKNPSIAVPYVVFHEESTGDDPEWIHWSYEFLFFRP